jgi:hypothetical protein
LFFLWFSCSRCPLMSKAHFLGMAFWGTFSLHCWYVKSVLHSCDSRYASIGSWLSCTLDVICMLLAGIDDCFFWNHFLVCSSCCPFSCRKSIRWVMLSVVVMDFLFEFTCIRVKPTLCFFLRFVFGFPMQFSPSDAVWSVSDCLVSQKMLDMIHSIKLDAPTLFQFGIPILWFVK